LTESELISYCEHLQDKVTQARVDAHLKQCFICDRRLELVREASVPSNDITGEDIAIVRRVIREERAAHQSTASATADLTPEIRFSERLTENLQQLCVSLQRQFSQPAILGGTEPGDEVWRWQSPDRGLESRAILERTGDLTIYLWSGDPEMDGVRLKAHLGLLRFEITMQRLSGSEFGANLQVPRLQRPLGLRDISIELI